MTEREGGFTDTQVNADLAAVYAPEVLSAAPRLLGGIDRERPSISYGVADREHWAWKFRDFPIGQLQLASYPLSWLWRYPLPDSPYHASDRLLEWILAMFEVTLGRQHRNGSFSGFVPFEQDAMSTLQLMYGLARTREHLGEALPPILDQRYREAYERAGRFVGRAEEAHAFVSNHSALMALSLRDAYDACLEERYLQRAQGLIDRILEEQSPDGWYNEYGGPDPGYETLGIFYLAQYWKRDGSDRVLESLRRAVEFQAYGVHPEGSVGGAYGSRHTSLYMPGGFELLGAELPTAAAIARFMRRRLARGNVVTPRTADTENLIPLSYGYLEACLAPAARHEPALPLPCELADLRRHFDDAGVSAISTPSYYAVVSGGKGAVCRVFDRVGEKLAYEDAGYIVRSGKRRWTSQMLGQVESRSGSRSEVSCTTRFAEVRQELPSPFRMIELRLLNLTLFRHPGLGNWLRKQIASRLILSRKTGPIRLHRRITFGPHRIDFVDRLELLKKTTIDEVELPSSFTAIHMGSAKYFHPNQLESLPRVPVQDMRADLNRTGSAEIAFSLVFSEHGESSLTVG